MNISIDRLIQLRKCMYWSQEDLAAASGLSIRTIQRLEATGSSSLESVKSVCSALNITPDELEKKPIDRRWMIGPCIGAMAGLFGCTFAYRSIFVTAARQGQSLSTYWEALIFISIMVAFTILFPAFMLRKYWNLDFDKSLHMRR